VVVLNKNFHHHDLKHKIDGFIVYINQCKICVNLFENSWISLTMKRKRFTDQWTHYKLHPQWQPFILEKWCSKTIGLSHCDATPFPPSRLKCECSTYDQLVTLEQTCFIYYIITPSCNVTVTPKTIQHCNLTATFFVTQQRLEYHLEWQDFCV